MRGKPLLRLSDGVGVCSAPFACVQAAPSAKNKIDLLELAYELCGTYRTRRTSTAPAYQVPPLMTMRSLRSFVSLNPSIAGARIVARVLPYLADGSASPRETKQALVLGLPTSYGGYGLGIPRMNYEVKAIAGAHDFRQIEFSLRPLLAGCETRRGVPKQGDARRGGKPYQGF